MANHFPPFRGRQMYVNRNPAPAYNLVPTNTPEPTFSPNSSSKPEFVYLGQQKRPAKRPRNPNRERRHGDYVWLLARVGKALNIRNIDDMSFLCKEFMESPELLLGVRKGKDIIDLLEKEHLIAENNLVFLQTLMYYIGRLDLYNYVLSFRQSRQKELADSVKNDGIDLKIFKNFHVSDDQNKFKIAKGLLSVNRQIKHARRWNIVPKEGVEGLKMKMNKLRVKMLQNASRIANNKINPVAKVKGSHKNLSEEKETKGRARKEEERFKIETGRDTATSRSTTMSTRLQEIDERLKDSLRSDMGVQRAHCFKSNLVKLPDIKSDEESKEEPAMLLDGLPSQLESPKFRRKEPLPGIGVKQKTVRFKKTEKLSFIKRKKVQLAKLPVNIYVPY